MVEAKQLDFIYVFDGEKFTVDEDIKSKCTVFVFRYDGEVIGHIYVFRNDKIHLANAVYDEQVSRVRSMLALTREYANHWGREMVKTIESRFKNIEKYSGNPDAIILTWYGIY